MSLFDVLEQRMQGIFESGSSMAPLPFKKLAKQAVREMKRSSVKMDGQTFAPSLYTVLVNPSDDAVIAPLYQQVTDELVDFVAHEAQNGGYALMANPMVRFIADQNVKPGKMEIVAEVVTPEVLDALRVEEESYAKKQAGAGMRGTAMGGGRMAFPVQRGRGGAGARANAGAGSMGRAASGASVMRALNQDDDNFSAGRPGRAAGQAAPAAGASARAAAPAAAPAQAPQAGAAPRPRSARTPQAQAGAPAARPGRPQAPAPVQGGPATCELVDTASGRTWRIGVASTVIGRDESTADLTLNDTNVSRRHAELKREGGRWKIVDLGSTNGTRVNGMRVTDYELTSGDTITMGLNTLEFREL